MHPGSRTRRFIVSGLVLASSLGVVTYVSIHSSVASPLKSHSRPAMKAAALAHRAKALTGTTAAEIDQFAATLATKGEDSSPTAVTWVATNRGAANLVMMGADVGSAANDVPVYALQIFGSFTLKFASTPFGVPPSGTVLQLVVSRSTFRVLDYGVLNNAPSMVSLGTPETDSLADIVPSSLSAWRSKFHVARVPRRARR